MGDFKLAASLEGHEDDVRGVIFPTPDLVLSASRDATVRMWKLLSSDPPTYDGIISSHGGAFINAISYLPPLTDYPKGLIISGGKDMIIEVRRPDSAPADNAEALLLGHSNNVCALDVDPTGTMIISGGWDGQGRVWRTGKWECDAVLEGHEGSVWAVLALDTDTIVTGCADKLIRIFDSAGKLLRTIRGHTDVVRALCRIPAGHPSRASFASASNDGTIRLWTLDGQPVAQLHGHESFIYSLGSLPSGELISSGEDRTVRIWRGNECIQTITLPAISVWGVAACAENGDIVSGSSDRVVRVFSRSKERHAPLEVLEAFEESVKSSSIPQQQVGDVNKEKLPGPEFLQQKSGTKEGQVVMIREPGGNVTAHQWSVGAQQWMSIGTVVDSAGSSGRKQDYLGKDYDYVFDVDIEDGKPPLKLPYNLSDNPYDAAKKFVENNELPITYLEQVATFITSNTQGATIGQTSEAAPQGADPWGTESRYRPGEASGTSAPPAPQRPKILPQKTYLSIKQANLAIISKKIKELNQQLVEAGDKEASLNPTDIVLLEKLIAGLETSSPAGSTPQSITDGFPLVLKMLTDWPSAQRLPGIDLLRLLAANTPVPATYRAPSGETLVSVLKSSGIFADPDRVNNVMLGIRTFANLFSTDAGLGFALSEFDQIATLALLHRSPPAKSTDRNTTIALTTLLINYSVLLTSPSLSRITTKISSSASASLDPQSAALTLLAPLSSILSLTDEGSQTADSESTYRALVATGTLLHLGDEVKEAAREVYRLAEPVRRARGRFSGEERVQNVGTEVLALLGEA